MIQEAKERHLPFDDSNTVIFNFEKFVEAVNKNPNLLSAQKDAIINLVVKLDEEGNPEKEIILNKFGAHEEFLEKIKEGYDNLKCDAMDSDEIVGWVFRRLLNIDIDDLMPAERIELSLLLNEIGSHEINDSVISEAIEDLETKLGKNGAW